MKGKRSFDAAEEALISLGLGVPASVDLGGGVILSFQRLEKRWRLCATQVGRKTRPLVEAPREIRARAAMRLGDLGDAILDEAERVIERTRAALKILKTFLEEEDGQADQTHR